ncbi:Fasciclin domain family protein [Penicillium freii]|uniref:FAS1 domain-containing protein n=1 Tax=Penicillium freii TaxID=48697 RepID=A0A101M8N6_PENFR|nr:Fasciclin domain family protein [Penicillium freii]KUM56019.1 hypothetical protein ACN42_g11213 [Penicillium freii]
MRVNWKRCARIVRWTTRATVIVATVALGIQFFTRNLLQGAVQPVRIPDTTPIDNNPPSKTIWELIRNDNRTSKFANIVGEFTNIVSVLDAPKPQFTVFVPTNEAFEHEDFAWDLPSFYWLYLVGYHMGPGAFSRDVLSRMNTAPSFIFADIYQQYPQRISVQRLSERFALNYRARYATSDIAGVNGYVHHVDRVLMLPKSTSDLLGDDPEFSILREGLIQTNVAVTINDTSTHVGQTVFAPSNAAFDQLGSKTKRFLFSPGGRRYLKALLEYHVVANRTMFTDVYFQERGRGQISLQEGSMLDLPTLVPGYNLSISIDAGDGARLSPLINNEVRIAQPDLVVMDGVVHKLDTVLLPPRSPRDDKEQQSWFGSLLHWATSNSEVKMGELVRRLEEFVDDAET